VKWALGLLFVTAAALWLFTARPEPVPPGVTVLRYMAWGNPEQLAAEQELIDEFTRRHPAIRVKLTLVPGSAYYQKLQVMLASGTAPDVFRCDHYQFPAYAQRGYFLPLDEFVQRDPDFRYADYFDQVIEEGRHAGRFYGVNTLFGARVIYYNKDLFARAGLTDPYVLYRRGEWTVEQFLDAAQRLTVTGHNGIVEQFGVLVHPLEVWTFAWGFGGEILTPDGSRCVADQPGTVQALQFLRDLRHRWHVTPTPAENALSAYTFESGRIAMVFDWAGAAPRYRQHIRNFDWDIVSIPSGPAGRHPMLKGNQLLIYRQTRAPEAAWQFLKFYVSRDAEALLCGRLRRAMTTRRDLAAAEEYLRSDRPPRQNDVWIDQYAIGRPLPITARWSDWQAEWNRAFELLMLNRLSPEEMAREAATRINAILAEEPY